MATTINLRFGDKTLTGYTYIPLTLTDEDITRMDGLIDAYHGELKDQARKAGQDPEKVQRPSIQATIYWLNNTERNDERRWYHKKYSPQIELEGAIVPLVEHASTTDGWIEPVGQEAMPDEHLTEELMAKARAAKLHRAISQLTPAQQSLIRDIYFAGLSAADVARRDGVSRAAVSKRLSKAKAALAALLEGQIQW